MTMAEHVTTPEFLEVPGLDRKLTVLDTCPDGQKVLWRKPYGNLFGDNFLERVLCRWNDDFVVWYWNHQSGGLCEGMYFNFTHYDDAEHPELEALIAALDYFDGCAPKTNIGERLARYTATKEAM